MSHNNDQQKIIKDKSYTEMSEAERHLYNEAGLEQTLPEDRS